MGGLGGFSVIIQNVARTVAMRKAGSRAVIAEVPTLAAIVFIGNLRVSGLMIKKGER